MFDHVVGGQVSEVVGRGASKPRALDAGDLVSAGRIPMASHRSRAGATGGSALAASVASDLLDGPVARGSAARVGPCGRPIADKLVMASASVCGVLRNVDSPRLRPSFCGFLCFGRRCFVTTFLSRRPRAIPARAGGKAVTVAQVLTLVAFLLDSPLLRPMAWATGAIAIYAIWDYYRVAPREERRVGD